MTNAQVRLPVTAATYTLPPLGAVVRLGLLSATVGLSPGGFAMTVTVHNVLNYGAVGDGVTDDTAAISAALTAAAGRVLYFPPGTYLMTSRLRPASYTHVIGAGMGVSIIKRGAALTDELFLPESSAVGVHFSDLTVDGNAGVNTSNTGAELGVSHSISNTDCWFERVEIKNFYGLGIGASGARHRIIECVITGLGTTSGSQYGVWFANAASSGVVVRGCTIRNCRQAAIYGGGTGFLIADNLISGNHVETSPTGGGQISWGDANGSGVVRGNRILAGGGDEATGIEVEGIYDGLIVEGNYIEEQQNWGIILQQVAGTGPIIVSNNVVKNCGTVGAVPGIAVLAGISNFIITGNRCYDDQGTKTQTYGLKIDAGASDNYAVYGNDFQGNLTGAMSDGGTGTVKQVFGNLPLSIGWSLAGSFIEMDEISDPSAPASDKGRLYVKDSGAGKTQLAARFPTGAVQVPAVEP